MKEEWEANAVLRGVTCFFSLKRPGQRDDLVDALTELGGKDAQSERGIAESTDPNAGACMKCGFRTDREWCPDCGRPVCWA